MGAREGSNRTRHDVILEGHMPTSTSLSGSPFLDVRSFETPTERVTRRLGLSSPFVEAFAFEREMSRLTYENDQLRLERKQ